jgi:hypothetical protein
MEVLELMRAMEPGTVFHGPELMQATGFSRALVVGSLTWLEDVGAVILAPALDYRGRHCWTVVADEERDEASLPNSIPAELLEGLEDDSDRLLAELSFTE